MTAIPTVLYVAWAPFFSGAERALLVLLDHLDRGKYRPVVAVGTDGELAAELRVRRISTVVAPIAYLGARTAPSSLRSIAGFLRLAARERVGLVHANDVPSFQPAGYAARLLGRTAITHVRFPDTRKGFGWFLRPGFAQALFVSADLRSSALQTAPDLFDGRSEVIHDGVHLPDPPDDRERRAIRAELGLPADRVVIAFTGQVSEIKGIWEFIEAARILAGQSSPASFVILGDDLKGKGATRQQAERAVADHGLAGRVTFLGFRTDARRLIPAFDVVAVPSHVEPLGNATLEAMAAGRPVVGSHVGGIPEMVVDGVTGLLVPARDARQLAAALGALVADPGRARALGQAGRARIAGSFRPDIHARKVEAVYDRVLTRKPAP